MRAYFVPKKHIELDLHGMSLLEAKKLVEYTIVVNAAEVEEIIIIHGYRRGNKLRNYIQDEFKSELVERKYLWLNPGITSLIISRKKTNGGKN